MKTKPTISIDEHTDLTKVTIALLDPEIAKIPRKGDVPFICIVEEEIAIIIDFPTHEALQGFLAKMAEL